MGKIKRGHWPKGKRRNADAEPEWRLLYPRVRELLRDPDPGVRGVRPEDRRSMAGLAAACGLREVRRWFGARDGRGRQIPSAEHLPAIRAWMRRVGGSSASAASAPAGTGPSRPRP